MNNCIVEDCPRRANKEQMCDPHREDRNRDLGKLCAYPTCGRGAVKSGLCSSHYSQRARGAALADLPASRKERVPTDPDGLPEHGTVRRYRLGCKCDECRKAKAGENRASTARHKEKHGVTPASRYRRMVRYTLGYWPQGGGSDFYVGASTRQGVYERDGWVCQLCGGPINKEAGANEPDAPTLDHIIPRSWTPGPDHSPSNLQTAHRGCNARKGNRSITLEQA